MTGEYTSCRDDVPSLGGRFQLMGDQMWPDQNKDEQSHWLHTVPQNIFAGCWIYVFPMWKIYRRWVFSHLGLAAVPQEAALDPNMRVGGTVNGHGIRHGLDVGYGMWQWFKDVPQVSPLQIAMKPWLGSLCYGNYSMFCHKCGYISSCRWFFLPGILLDVTHRPESVPIYLSDKGWLTPVTHYIYGFLDVHASQPVVGLFVTQKSPINTGAYSICNWAKKQWLVMTGDYQLGYVSTQHETTLRLIFHS